MIPKERIGELRRLWDGSRLDESIPWATADELLELLSAASQLAETEQRCEALRKYAIETVECRDGSKMRICNVCSETSFDNEQREWHVPGCIASPQSEAAGGKST